MTVAAAPSRDASVTSAGTTPRARTLFDAFWIIVPSRYVPGNAMTVCPATRRGFASAAASVR